MTELNTSFSEIISASIETTVSLLEVAHAPPIVTTETVGNHVGMGITELLIDFININRITITNSETSEGPPPSGTDMTPTGSSGAINTVKKTALINLPFKVTELNPEMVSVLNRNFNEIEYYLSRLQQYMLAKGAPTLAAFDSRPLEDIVLIGRDSEKPQYLAERKGRYFYWAYNTRKLYVLLPARVDASPVVRAAIAGLTAALIRIYYTNVPVPAENVSVSLGVSISLTSV